MCPSYLALAEREATACLAQYPPIYIACQGCQVHDRHADDGSRVWGRLQAGKDFSRVWVQAVSQDMGIDSHVEYVTFLETHQALTKLLRRELDQVQCTKDEETASRPAPRVLTGPEDANSIARAVSSLVPRRTWQTAYMEDTNADSGASLIPQRSCTHAPELVATIPR